MALFFRTVQMVNKELPIDKRIPLIDFRNRRMEIKRLFEDLFPDSSLTTVWFLTVVASATAIAIGIVFEIAR
jgi:hypothetical protein